MPLPVKSTDSERGVSNPSQTAHTSIDPGDGWTLVTSKSQRFKPVAERRAIPDWPSSPTSSSVAENNTLQGSNSTATKGFYANRVDLHELKSEQNSREHIRRSSAFASSGSADYVLRQSPNSSRHLESTGLNSFLSCEVSPRQDLFSTDQEPFSRPDVKCTELTEHARTPVHFSCPSWNSSTESKTMDFGNTPKSQWESLEQISPLQIHGVLTTKAKSVPPLDRCISPQTGSNVHGCAPPAGVFTLCAHFLQDNRKGHSFRYPNPCLSCTKRSKLLYGIWRSDTKEWQVMRPYPKDVNPNVPFKLCWHFSNGFKCQKSPCTFAHGKKELTFWISERQSGIYNPALKLTPRIQLQNVCLIVCLA